MASFIGRLALALRVDFLRELPLLPLFMVDHVGTYILKSIFRVFEFDKLLVYCKHSSFNENNKCFLHTVYFTLMGIDRI